MTRFGIGYDVHRLVEGRPLILGGVHFDFEKGLDGHSDADVLSHAIADALLGAIADGDIGHHFPNTDPACAGISSLHILEHTARRLAMHHATIVNIDSTLIAEAPKIAPHIAEMRNTLARTLHLPPSRISIKATTNEGMGFPGRGEGIAALAIASVVQAEIPEPFRPVPAASGSERPLIL